jgi:predicted dehydrogenase
MAEIGIGIVGGGYMGKAHAVAMSAVGAVFDTIPAPAAGMIAASSERLGRALPQGVTALRAPPPTGASWWPIRRSRRW